MRRDVFSSGHPFPVLERFVARTPALLLLGLLGLSAYVLLAGGQGDRLLALLPAAILLVAYLRAGVARRAGGRS